MKPRPRKKFAFISLAYNHESHVIAHLESIRYQIVNHGTGVDVSLVVTDDCSRDRTREWISEWVGRYENLFHSVRLVYTSENVGTCEVLRRAMECLDVDGFKITGADDIYGPGSIFDHAFLVGPTALITATPIAVYGDRLVVRRKELLQVLFTNAIYFRAKFINRVRFLSAHNAPNLIYSAELFRSGATRELLSKFKFTEDWCLMFALARQIPDGKVLSIRDTFVYHRHSLSHVYLTRNEIFREDKIRMFDMLLASSERIVDKWRVRSRKTAFLAGGGGLRYLLMPEFYFFVVGALFAMPRVLKNLFLLNINIERHERHLVFINTQARAHKRLDKA